MSIRQMLNIIFSVTLLSPVVSAASCLDNNELANNTAISDCGYKGGYHLADLDEAVLNHPASHDKKLVRSEYSTPGDSQNFQGSSEKDVKKAAIRNDTELDNYDWVPPEWYEVY